MEGGKKIVKGRLVPENFGSHQGETSLESLGVGGEGKKRKETCEFCLKKSELKDSEVLQTSENCVSWWQSPWKVWCSKSTQSHGTWFQNHIINLQVWKKHKWGRFMVGLCQSFFKTLFHGKDPPTRNSLLCVAVLAERISMSNYIPTNSCGQLPRTRSKFPHIPPEEGLRCMWWWKPSI